MMKALARYLPLSNNYLTLASILIGSDHHDTAAQQRAGGAAELPQQPCLGTAGIGRIAAEPLIMVAGDQETLVRARPHHAASKRLEAVAKTVIGVGRAGVAEHAGARAAARGHALDELRGLLDPAGVEHGARAQEHQPW